MSLKKEEQPKKIVEVKSTEARAVTSMRKYPANFEDARMIAAQFPKFSERLIASVIFSQSTFTRDRIMAGPCSVRWIGFGRFFANPYLVRNRNESRGKPKVEYSKAAQDAAKELKFLENTKESRSVLDDISSKIVRKSIDDE